MKSFIRYILEVIKRFFQRKYAILFFIFHSSIMYKPLHVLGLKYVKIGKKITIEEHSRLECYKSNSIIPEVIIEDNVWIGFDCSLLVTGKLFIGSNTIIASKVLIATENHGIDPLKGNYCSQPLDAKPVYIGRNCWIGEHCCVLPGSSIGDYSVIGAGAVVTSNIPPYSIAVGNPAKVIKQYDFELKKWVRV